MQDVRAGKTQRLASQALEARAQGEVLTLNLLQQPLTIEEGTLGDRLSSGDLGYLFR